MRDPTGRLITKYGLLPMRGGTTRDVLVELTAFGRRRICASNSARYLVQSNGSEETLDGGGDGNYLGWRWRGRPRGCPR